jgi:serine/threonine protein kinase
MTLITYQKNPFLEVYEDILEREIEGRFTRIRIGNHAEKIPCPLNFLVDSMLLHATEIIGAGSYSKVFEAHLTGADKIVALKISDGNPLHDKSIIREAKIITQIYQRCFNAINHIGLLYHWGPYTISRLTPSPFFSIFSSFNNEKIKGRALVLEMLGPNLKKLATKNLDFSELQLIAKDIAKALLVLKKAEVIHADLKLENIVTTKFSYCKIIDFGLSRLSSEVFSKENITLPMQTEYYRSPEVWLFGKVHAFQITQAIDMWSFGCILAELKTGRVLFRSLADIFFTLEKPQHKAYIQIYDEVLKKHTSFRKSSLKEKLFGENELNNDIERYFLDLLQKIFVYDSLERITPKEVLKHPFIRELFFV